MFHALILTVSAAASWFFATERDPLNQPVFVAQSNGPGAQYIRFMCGGVAGVTLQFNLGAPTFSAEQFSTEDPPWEDVRLIFDEGAYDTTAKRAPLTEGMGTYEIKGGDAVFIVRLFRAGDQVEIAHGERRARFDLNSAGSVIDQVLDACPFKYPEEAQ